MKGNHSSGFQRYEFIMYDPARGKSSRHYVERMSEALPSTSTWVLNVGYAPLIALGIAGLVAILAIAERWFL